MLASIVDAAREASTEGTIVRARRQWAPGIAATTAAKAAASAVLGPDNVRTAVLLLGPGRHGTTECAVELARQHRNRFGTLVWWQAASAYPQLSTQPAMPPGRGETSFASGCQVDLSLNVACPRGKHKIELA